jgi:hypothetical protein
MLLQYCKDAQILILTDAAATRDGILDSIRQHLINNPQIVEDDPILVYFACKGQQLEAPASTAERDIDLLVPYDFCEDVPGISDIEVNGLLCELARKKGRNIVSFPDMLFISILCSEIPVRP